MGACLAGCCNHVRVLEEEASGPLSILTSAAKGLVSLFCLSVAPRWRSLMWRAQATAEGLTLLVANNKAGYLGVYLKNPSHPKPYQVEMRRGGKKVSLGNFATAEEAALCVARSPEGQAAAQRAAAAPPPLTGDDDGGDDTGEESEEEEIQVLDAVEVLVASDDGGDEEALAMEVEEVTLVVKRKRLP